MNPEQALAATKDYGLIAVVMVLMAFFLGWLVIFVLRQNRERERIIMTQNEARENRLVNLIENHIAGMERKQDERHQQNRDAIAELKEAARRTREEHEIFLNNQKSIASENNKIAVILDKLLLKVKIGAI